MWNATRGLAAAALLAIASPAHGQCDHAAQLATIEGPGTATLVETIPATTVFDITLKREKVTTPLETIVIEHSGPCEMIIVGQGPSECPPEAEVAPSYSETVGFTWDFTAEGSADVGTSLVTKLIAKLELQASIGAQLSGSTVTTETLRIEGVTAQCWDQTFELEETTYEWAGTAHTTGEEKIWIIDFGPDDVTLEVTTKCDAESATGSAKAYGGISIRPKNVPCCDGPGPDGNGCCGCAVPD